MDFIVGILIGIVVGWQIPQPTWAAALWEKIKGIFKKKE